MLEMLSIMCKEMKNVAPLRLHKKLLSSHRFSWLIAYKRLKLQQSTVNERGDGAFSLKLRCKNASLNSNSHYCYCYCICKTLQVSRGGEPKKLKGKKEEKLCAAKKKSCKAEKWKTKQKNSFNCNNIQKILQKTKPRKKKKKQTCTNVVSKPYVPSELQIAEYWQHSHNLLLLLLLLCSSALVALILLLLPIVVDQISSSFFPLLLFFFFFFLARFAKWNSTDCFTNNVWQQMNYFWIQKQKIKKDLEIWQENRRSPEEGKTERKRTGEHGPLDATRTTEDKTRRRVRTDGHDKNTRRRNPDQYTDRGIKL